METPTSVDRLLVDGVLDEQHENLSLSARFESAIEDHEARISTLSPDELTRLIQDHLGGDVAVEPLVALGREDPRSIAELCAVADQLDTDSTNWLSLLPVLRLFRTEPVPTDGVPEPFVPIDGALLPHYADVYSRVLVYVWLDDCPPCDVLMGRLESIFDRPREVLLLAVYGPDDRAFLARTYDVTAGPALLFMRDGRVDSRLYGDHDERVIANEVDRLVE